MIVIIIKIIFYLKVLLNGKIITTKQDQQLDLILKIIFNYSNCRTIFLISLSQISILYQVFLIYFEIIPEKYQINLKYPTSLTNLY